MKMKKDWVDYRYEEMEEKSNVTQLPEYDMDGSRFNQPEDFETDERNDAYIWSISERLYKFSILMDRVL